MGVKIRSIVSIRSVILFVALMIFVLEKTSAQTDLTWETLSDVTFDIEYDEEAFSYIMVPEFSKEIKSYEKVHVIIEGYFIQMDTEDNVHVLSRYPYASCFFCGGAGPESVIELQMSKKVKGVFLDERVFIEGTLLLNASDMDHFNYIIEDAQFIEG